MCPCRYFVRRRPESHSTTHPRPNTTQQASAQVGWYWLASSRTLLVPRSSGSWDIKRNHREFNRMPEHLWGLNANKVIFLARGG